MRVTKGKTVDFVHHGDYSGDIEVRNKQSGELLALISFEDMKHMVTDAVRRQRIAKLEQMDDNELLGLDR